MQTFIRLGLIVMSPYLLFVYWKNTQKNVEDLHAHYELNYE